MTINKITYEQLFPLAQYSNVRLGMEITLAEGDMIEDAYTKAKTITENNFNRLFPQVDEPLYEPPSHTQSNNSPIPVIQTDPKQSATERTIHAMNQCTTIEVLDSFFKLAQSKKEFMDAYWKKKEELTK